MTHIDTYLNNFFFNSHSKFLRRSILIKLICLFSIGNALLVSPDILEIFSGNGLINSAINDKFLHSYEPRISWFVDVFGTIGLSQDTLVMSIFLMYVIALVFIILKKNQIFFSIIACSFKMLLINSSYIFSYGADSFILFLLFVNILLNISEKIDKSKGNLLFSFTGRFVQIQLCIIYFFAGFGKILGNDWMDGNAVWYIMNTYAPEFLNLFENTTKYPFLYQLFTITILVELLYPILIIFKQTRKLTLILIIGIHLGIIVFMKFYTFGLVMILLNIIGFGKTLFRMKVKDPIVLKI